MTASGHSLVGVSTTAESMSGMPVREAMKGPVSPSKANRVEAIDIKTAVTFPWAYLY